MPDNQGLERQKDWCVATGSQLNRLCDDIKYIARQYHQGIEDLRHENFLGEFTKILAQGRTDFINKADLLIREVEDVHLKYVKDRQKTIEEHIAQLPTVNQGN